MRFNVVFIMMHKRESPLMGCGIREKVRLTPGKYAKLFSFKNGVRNNETVSVRSERKHLKIYLDTTVVNTQDRAENKLHV